jgi:putative ABC transport system permease protein
VTIDLELAYQQVRPRLGQLATAVVIIALGVALSAGMLLANAALRDSFEESIDAIAGRADLRVAASSGGRMPESLTERVRNTPGVDAALPLLLERLHLEDGSNDAVRIAGVDLLDDSAVRVYEVAGRGAIDDPLLFMSRPDSALVPASFAAARDLREGSALRVRSPHGPVTLRVRGLLEAEGVARAFGGHLVVMDLVSAQQAFEAEGQITQIDLRVADGADREDVRRALLAVLPAHLTVERPEDLKVDLSRTFSGFQVMLDAIAASGLLLAVLITGNRLTTIYQSRLWEMGVLRALGMSFRALMAELMVEALLVCAAAVVLGLVLGTLFAQLIVSPIADVTSLNFKHVIAVDWVAPQPGPLAIAALGGIASGLVAAFAPAYRASRTAIAAVLNQARLRDPWPEAPGKGRVRIAAVATVAALLGAEAVADVGMLSGVTMALALVAGGLLVGPILRGTSRPLGSLLGSAAEIGVEDQGRVPSRAMGAAAVLMVGVAIVIWISTMRESFSGYVVEQLMRTRQGDLVVDSAFNEIATGDSQARLSEEVLERLREIPSVEAVGAAVAAKSASPETGVLAVDPIRLLDAGFGSWRLEAGAPPDALHRVAAGEAALIDTNLASRRKISVGETVALNTPTRVLELPVAGVIRTIPLSQQGDVIISRALFRETWNDSTVTQAYLRVRPGARVADVAARVRRELGERYHLRVMSSEQLSRWFGQSVRQGFAFLDAMMALTLLVVLLGSADALAANVIERAREIGTLRALGLSRADVVGMLFSQSLAIGTAGALLAVAVGVAMSLAFVHGLIPSLLGWQLELRWSPTLVASAAGLGVLACLLGTLPAAVRVARLSVVDAIREE